MKHTHTHTHTCTHAHWRTGWTPSEVLARPLERNSGYSSPEQQSLLRESDTRELIIGQEGRRCNLSFNSTEVPIRCRLSNQTWGHMNTRTASVQRWARVAGSSLHLPTKTQFDHTFRFIFNFHDKQPQAVTSVDSAVDLSTHRTLTQTSEEQKTHSKQTGLHFCNKECCQLYILTIKTTHIL